MMSHLDPSKIGPDTKNILAICTKAKWSPPDDLIKLVADSGRDIRDISDIEFCAAHLVSCRRSICSCFLFLTRLLISNIVIKPGLSM